MAKELLLASLSFGFFVVCPRMAGMLPLISKNTNSSVLMIVLTGALCSIPILMLMVMVFGKLGIAGALAVCVLTDLCAAVIMGGINVKAGFETFIIALFVIAGVKAAPLIVNSIIK